ncbi:MAG: zinc ABC transporter substrate-binding protein [Endomicrobiia bacterium]
MKKVYNIFIVLSATIFFSISFADVQKLKFVATTTHISNILSAIGREKVDVATIVSANLCPGHFDVNPGMVKKTVDTKYLLYHGWERWIKKIVEINPDIKLYKIEVYNNWLLPEINLKAAYEIFKLLCEIDSENKYFYELNYKNYEEEIEKFVSKINKGKYSKIKVLCARHQYELLNWLGFSIIDTYNTSEELSLKEIKKIIKIAKQKRVDLIVDNLQSSFKLGKQVAQDVNAKYLILTNFPTENSYLETLKHILEQIDTIIYE